MPAEDACPESHDWRGDLLVRESMAAHNSWRVGGFADRFYLPADLQDLARFLRTLPRDEPLLWLGLGSNLLVRDGGIRGTVICTLNRLREIRCLSEGVIRVEAGVPCAHVARFCAEAGLKGAEFLAGIPGTMGGALAMNAGAFGGETWDLVHRVETVDRGGVLRIRGSDHFEVGYRSVRGIDGEWFVAVELALEPGDSQEARLRIRDLLAKRSRTQPTQLPSCGSVFRNPPDDFAARLIEVSGLKGFRMGGAEVSEKHANFIVNVGGASASDIEALILHVRQVVLSQHGVDLWPEVRIVGSAFSEDRDEGTK